jgi:hypothetical protein
VNEFGHEAGHTGDTAMMTSAASQEMDRCAEEFDAVTAEIRAAISPAENTGLAYDVYYPIVKRQQIAERNFESAIERFLALKALPRRRQLR